MHTLICYNQPNRDNTPNQIVIFAYINLHLKEWKIVNYAKIVVTQCNIVKHSINTLELHSQLNRSVCVCTECPVYSVCYCADCFLLTWQVVHNICYEHVKWTYRAESSICAQSSCLLLGWGPLPSQGGEVACKESAELRWLCLCSDMCHMKAFTNASKRSIDSWSLERCENSSLWGKQGLARQLQICMFSMPHYLM